MAGYVHINSNTTNLIQKGLTQLMKVVVNQTGTSWNVAVYDGINASGALVANLSPQNRGNYDYECNMTQGLFIQTTGTTPGDVTIVYE